MSDILQFDKTITRQNITVPETALMIEDCRIYTISKDQAVKGKFYTNLNLSYGKVTDKEIVIEFKNKVFKESLCFIKDASSDKEVAKLRMSNNTVNLNLRLDVPGQHQYQWKDISHEYASLFEPKTWGTYVGRLSNGPEEVIIRGKFQRKLFNTVFESHRALSGEIEFTEQFDPLLLICGLYMMETDLYYRNQSNLI